jgi:basic membrane lipoprotein Med (substrate-binding protein (PBP1-ABC) superfamily)
LYGEQLEIARDEYVDARRKAKRRYAQAASEGRNGYLPALEGVLEHSPVYAERRIGMEDVPLHKIVGTATHSRARSFAPGFLPLPPEGSEFSEKWVKVYARQLDQGITDPIEVREYLNWYWVVEGNKRVSVLKLNGAFQIEANVTRLLPKRDSEDPAVTTYFRFLPFKEKTGIKDIWIREPGGFEKLLEYIDTSPFAGLDEKERYRRFYWDVYYPFRMLYKERGGDRLDLTTGEAFLRYVDIIGFPGKFSDEEHGPRIEEVIKELSMRSEEVGVTTEPIRQSEPTLLESIGHLMKAGKTLRISFVHYANPAVHEWTRAHEDARRALESALDDRVRTKVFWAEDPASGFADVIRQAASQTDVVFATAGILYDDTRKVAMEKPHVRFFVASREKSSPHVRTYSPRTHETHFLSGMIAGALRTGQPIGFTVSTYSAYALALINAFALGAQGVNRAARIQLSWNDNWFNDYFDPDLLPEELRKGTELFFHNILPPRESGYTGYGLYAYKDGTFTKYANLIYDWREFYHEVVENILAGNIREFESDSHMQARFLTFWGGLKTGIIDLTLDPARVPAEVRRVVEGMKTLILLGEFSPFSGPLRDRDGRERVPEGSTLDYDSIIAMDYLVEGIDGPLADPRRVITS